VHYTFQSHKVRSMQVELVEQILEQADRAGAAFCYK
jgi:hypothetical protein